MHLKPTLEATGEQTESTGVKRGPRRTHQGQRLWRGADGDGDSAARVSTVAAQRLGSSGPRDRAGPEGRERRRGGFWCCSCRLGHGLGSSGTGNGATRPRGEKQALGPKGRGGFSSSFVFFKLFQTCFQSNSNPFSSFDQNHSLQ